MDSYISFHCSFFYNVCSRLKMDCLVWTHVNMFDSLSLSLSLSCVISTHYKLPTTECLTVLQYWINVQYILYVYFDMSQNRKNTSYTDCCFLQSPILLNKGSYNCSFIKYFLFIFSVIAHLKFKLFLASLQSIFFTIIGPLARAAQTVQNPFTVIQKQRLPSCHCCILCTQQLSIPCDDWPVTNEILCILSMIRWMKWFTLIDTCRWQF